MCVMGRELSRLKRSASILIDPSSWGIDSTTKHRTVLQTGMSHPLPQGAHSPGEVGRGAAPPCRDAPR